MTKVRLSGCARCWPPPLYCFAAPASAQRVDRIVAFGDSYADDGNLPAPGRQPARRPSVYPTGPLLGRHQLCRHLVADCSTCRSTISRSAARCTNNTNTNSPFLPGFTTKSKLPRLGAQAAIFPTVSGRSTKTTSLAVSIGGNDARVYQQTAGDAGRAPAAAGAVSQRHRQPQRAGRGRRAEHQLPRRQHRASSRKSPTQPGRRGRSAMPFRPASTPASSRRWPAMPPTA